MILHRWYCVECFCRELFSCQLPALFRGVQFRAVVREVFDFECFAVSCKARIHYFAVVAGGIISVEQHAPESFHYFVKEARERALFFAFGKRVYKRFLCADRKNADCFWLFVNDCYRPAPSARPAPCNCRDEAECCFIFRAHDKTFRPVIFDLPFGFFLKRLISSGAAVL